MPAGRKLCSLRAIGGELAGGNDVDAAWPVGYGIVPPLAPGRCHRDCSRTGNGRARPCCWPCTAAWVEGSKMPPGDRPWKLPACSAAVGKVIEVGVWLE